MRVVTGLPRRTYTFLVSQESSEQTEETGNGLGITDDQLPEDLQPTEDNPLAQPADDDVPDDLLTEASGRPRSGGDSEDDSAPGEGDASDTSSSAEPSSETGPDEG